MRAMSNLYMLEFVLELGPSNILSRHDDRWA
jgi:hypothetical protein